jgi:iron complex outermembrane receptor protein
VISNDFNTYKINTDIRSGGSVGLPYSFASSQIIDPNLKPQRTAEYEVGLDLRFLKDRIGIDAAVFTKTTSQQIATKDLDNASGATSYYTNIGTVRNRGIEIGLNLVPVRTRDFSWNSTINFTKYANKILSYATTTPYITLESQYFTEVRAYVGQAYGDIYSFNAFTPYQAYDGAGKPIADPANGQRTIYNSGGTWRYMPVQYSSAPYDNTKARKLGNINPNFLWSFSNTFNYKNWFAGVMIDGRVGGKQLSFTNKYGVGTGALKSSLAGRDAAHGGVSYTGTDANGIQGTWNDGIIPQGVFAQGQTTVVNGTTVDLGGMSFKDAVGKGYVNPIPAAQYYYQAYGSWSRGIADLNTFDDTWVSLREVSIGYNLPKELTQKAKIQNLRISFVGRNLLYIYNGMPNHVNPESIFNNRSSSAFDFGAGPSTRSLGVSLNANF